MEDMSRRSFLTGATEAALGAAGAAALGNAADAKPGTDIPNEKTGPFDLGTREDNGAYQRQHPDAVSADVSDYTGFDAGSFEASKDARDFMEAFRGATDYSAIQSGVEEFLRNHPLHIGKSTVGPDGRSVSQEATYDPFFDLEIALRSRVQDMNATTIGLMLKELDKRQREIQRGN